MTKKLSGDSLGLAWGICGARLEPIPLLLWTFDAMAVEVWFYHTRSLLYIGAVKQTFTKRVAYHLKIITITIKIVTV